LTPLLQRLGELRIFLGQHPKSNALSVRRSVRLSETPLPG
jgi:hypothetical protein